ncbi:MAG: GNAT family N-acetyltransferase [Phototrophicaceae bacterium]
MTDIIYRPATLDDIDTFYDLYRHEHIESYGNFGMTKDEVFAEMKFPNFDLSQHTMYAFLADGTQIAYAELRVWRDIPVRPVLYSYVHPDYRGQGIGTYLTQWGIEHAQQFVPLVPDHARVVLGCFSNMDDGCELLENLSFTNTRQSHLMSMAIASDSPKAQFPAGMHIITMKDHPVLIDFIHVYKETFKDHRGAVDEPLSAAVERWEQFIKAGEYPPENFVLIKDGNNDVGVMIMSDKSDDNPEQMFIHTLGTMPKYRKRGIASNLLYYAQDLARKKGKKRLGLSVDGSSLTGANKLYEKVGFDIDMVYHAYELEIRAGEELTNQG